MGKTVQSFRVAVQKTPKRKPHVLRELDYRGPAHRGKPRQKRRHRLAWHWLWSEREPWGQRTEASLQHRWLGQRSTQGMYRARNTVQIARALVGRAGDALGPNQTFIVEDCAAVQLDETGHSLRQRGCCVELGREPSPFSVRSFSSPVIVFLGSQLQLRAVLHLEPSCPILSRSLE